MKIGKNHLSIRETVLWLVAGSNIILVIVGTLWFADSIRLDFSESPVFNALFMLSPLVLLILHSSWTLSPVRALFFIMLAVGIGLISEYFGLHYGVIFGGTYYYPIGGIKILDVPLMVLLFWAAFSYTAYSLVTGGLYWLGQNKPAKLKSPYWFVLLLALIDAYVILAIDLLMDPLQVWLGNWQWTSEGSYFGIPVGNFIGWFSVGFLVCWLFRTFEYFYPIKPRLPHTVYLIPLVGYTAMAMAMVIMALRINLLGLASIGGLAMMIPVVVGGWLYYRAKKLTTD